MPPKRRADSAPGQEESGTKRKSGRSGTKNFYAVRAGHEGPKIYTDYSDCKASVSGYKGAVCKFDSRAAWK